MIPMVIYKTKGYQPVFLSRLRRIIKQFPEMTAQRTEQEAYEAIRDATRSLDEWCEVYVEGPCGKLMGFAILTDDDDAHVGPLMGVQWCWVAAEAPKGTMLAIHRKCRQITKAANYRFMAYTKRLSMGRYEINYIDLGEPSNGQES